MVSHWFQGHDVASHAYNRKMRQYYEDCNRAELEFIIMAVESFGGFHPKALMDIKKLSSQMALQLGREEAEILNHFRQHLSILLQRGNVAI